MKLTCDGLALASAVLKVSKAMPIKKNNNILEGIRLVAKDDSVVLTATDLELSIVKRIPATVQIEGEVVVIGKYFADLVKSLSDDSIMLECTNGKNLTIKYGDNEGYIKCMDADEYPAVERIQESACLELKRDDLKDLITKVVFAAAQEDARPILKGCLFEVAQNTVTAVALDGYRLALCHKALVNETPDAKYVIPARTLVEVQRILDEADDTVRIVLGDGRMMADINDTQLISRLITGDFINYRSIIATGFTSTAVFSRDQFSDSINRAAIISRSDKNNTIKLELNENALLIDSRSEFGNVHESIPAEIEGKDCVISFNCKYLQDVLGAIGDEFIKMNIKSSNAPCIFTAPEGDEYLVLVLPMRVGA